MNKPFSKKTSEYRHIIKLISLVYLIATKVGGGGIEKTVFKDMY